MELTRRSVLILGLIPLAGCAGRNRASTEVAGNRLSPYTNCWTIQYRRADGRVVPQGTFFDTLSYPLVAGRRVGRRKQVQIAASGAQVTTINLFDPVTMAPLLRDWQAPGKHTHVDISGGTMRSEWQTGPGIPPVRHDTVLAGSTYDFLGGLYGLLLATLPMREGFQTTLRSIGEANDSIVPIPVIVRGLERVRTNRDSASAWRVEVPESPFGLMTFWLTPSPPFIIRLTLPLSGGEISYDRFCPGVEI